MKLWQKKKIKNIDNKVSKKIIKEIPNNKRDRIVFLQQKLEKYIGKSVYCNDLKKNVKITVHGIKETAAHAWKDKESIIAALNIVNVIKYATLYNTDMPKAGNQTKKFNFQEILILYTCINNIGIAKLTIGKKKRDYFIYYCITCNKKS